MEIHQTYTNCILLQCLPSELHNFLNFTLNHDCMAVLSFLLSGYATEKQTIFKISQGRIQAVWQPSMSKSQESKLGCVLWAEGRHYSSPIIQSDTCQSWMSGRSCIQTGHIVLFSECVIYGWLHVSWFHLPRMVGVVLLRRVGWWVGMSWNGEENRGK